MLYDFNPLAGLPGLISAGVAVAVFLKGIREANFGVRELAIYLFAALFVAVALIFQGLVVRADYYEKAATAGGIQADSHAGDLSIFLRGFVPPIVGLGVVVFLGMVHFTYCYFRDTDE